MFISFSIDTKFSRIDPIDSDEISSQVYHKKKVSKYFHSSHFLTNDEETKSKLITYTYAFRKTHNHYHRSLVDYYLM